MSTTIRDGNDSNRIYGDEGKDFIYGNGGNDTLSGSGGSNLLSGGDGNDVLLGLNAPGNNDILYGGAGQDTFVILHDNGIGSSITDQNMVEIKDYESGDSFDFGSNNIEELYDVHYGLGNGDTVTFIRLIDGFKTSAFKPILD